MGTRDAQPIDGTATSAGHALASAEWLDLHFQTCRPEYEAEVKAAGIQRGWQVLDAGCGGGSFLPLLADLVGAAGALVALDLAAEHVAAIASRSEAGAYVCPVTARQGSVTEIPLADRTVDAVWNANVSQYLSDVELDAALAEFRRVLRPGGLLALKESDATAIQFGPASPLLYWRLCEAMTRAGNLQAAGSLRAPALPAWLRRAGFVEVRSRLFVCERTAPLEPAAHAFCAQVLAWFAQQAATAPLPDADRAAWGRIAQVGAPDHILRSPDFSWREGHLLVLGRAPQPGA